MRSLAFALSLFPTLTFAETFHVPAELTAATLYPASGLLTYAVPIDLPEGRHTVITSIAPNVVFDVQMPDGVVLLGQQTAAQTVDPRDLLSARQQAAFDALRAAEAAVSEIEDQISGLRDKIAATEAEVQFYQSIQAPSDTLPSPEQLQQTAKIIAAGIVPLQAQIAKDEATIRALDEPLEAANDALFRARVVFNRSGAPKKGARYLQLELAVEQPVTASIPVLVTNMNVSWQPRYDINLDEAENSVSMAQFADVFQNTGVDWPSVKVRLSTTVPTDSVNPTEPFANIASIVEVREGSTAPMIVPTVSGAARTLAMDAPVAELAVTGKAVGAYEGAEFVFDFPGEQSLPFGRTQLRMVDLSMEAAVETWAVPRFDETAFRVAFLTNESGGPILAGPTRVSRNGAYLGESYLQELPDGADARLSFGADEFIRLERVLQDRQSGDRGSFSRSNTREEKIQVIARNNGQEPRDVRVFYALPVTEQEDLEINTSFSVPPSETNALDVRGLAVWDFQLGAGDGQQLDITMSFTWPEGQRLNWRP